MTYDLNSRQNISWFGAFFILLGLMGAGLIVGSIAGFGVFAAMTGKGIAQFEKEMQNPANLQAIRIVQLISTFFMFFLPAYLTALIINKKPKRFLGFNFNFSPKQAAIVVAIMLAALPLVGSLAELNKIIPLPANLEKTFKSLEDAYSKTVLVLSKITGFADYIYALIVMGLAPAIFEEVFFRGGVQNILARWMKSPLAAIIITSILFSLIHASWYGFLPRIALGIILGLLYQYSGSLWVAILAHFFHNGLIVTQIYYLTVKGKPIEDSMNETMPLWWGLIALVVLWALFLVFRKNAERERIDKFPPEDRAAEEKWIA